MGIWTCPLRADKVPRRYLHQVRVLPSLCEVANEDSFDSSRPSRLNTGVSDAIAPPADER